MAESGGISRTPLLAAGFMLIVVLGGYFVWQSLPPSTLAPAVDDKGGQSSPGFEVRYNAVIALARRGSPRIAQVDADTVAGSIGLLTGGHGYVPAVATLHAGNRLTVLAEMLDEAQQMRNFRVKLDNNQDAPDELAARTTVITALKAVVELHRQAPHLDLSMLDQPIVTLTKSSNPVVQQEAVRTQDALSTD